MNAFRYFAASEADMLGLLAGLRECDICGETARCFSLERAIKPSAPDVGVGCVTCLRAGRFGFPHLTELGFLDANGLLDEGDDFPEPPRRVFIAQPAGDVEASESSVPPSPGQVLAPESLDDLRRTPDFPTWNEVPWLAHCGDFMTYLGTWQPPQVREAARDAGVSPARYLEDIEGAPVPWPGDDAEIWSLTLHVFVCRVCGRRRSFLDLD